MTDQVVPESWHIPRALSNEALRLLSSLPMDEIERRLLAPIPTPIPVSERLPRPEDCDREGRCWFYTPASSVLCGYWVLRVPDHMRKWETHWLPVHALPLLEVNQ